MKPAYAATDIEGIIFNPGGDFAWESYRLLSEETKAKFSEGGCKVYDGDFDDLGYFHDLDKSQRSSTGKWPELSECIAAIDGKTDDDLIALAKKTSQFNPGADKLMKYLLEKFGGNFYCITTSHPAVGLPLAEKYDIPFSHVFTNGIQIRRDSPKRDLEEEIKRRSPMKILSECKEELETFLDGYKIIWGALATAYKEYNKTPNDVGINKRISDLRENHNVLFKTVSNSRLRNVLEHMFLSERGVMGSHRKVDAMRSIKDDRSDWTYVDDGIVGAMPVDWAKYGFSVNTTNKHLLSLSKLNFATTDMSNLIPVYESILHEAFEPKIKEWLNSEKIRVFTPRDVQQDIETVIAANKEMKNKLKELYVPVKM